MVGSSSYTSMSQSSLQQDSVYQQVTVGMVTETFPNENRVVLTPSLARECINNGHKVIFQKGAGTRAGFTDEMYTQIGATTTSTAEEVYKNANVIVKVQQPTTQEMTFIQPKQVVFCFMNFNDQTTPSTVPTQSTPTKNTTTTPTQQTQETTNFLKAMTQRGAVVIGYQYIQNSADNFPVFNAMAELTGYLGMQQANYALQTQGRTLGSLSGVSGANVLILGATPSGMRAAEFAVGVGAQVTVMDTCVDTLRRVSEGTGFRVNTCKYTSQTLEQMLPNVDAVIGAVMTPTTKAPMLLTQQQMMMLRPGSCCIDLAACMGGNFTATTTTNSTTTNTNIATPTNFYNPTTITTSGVTCYTYRSLTNAAPNAFATAVSNAAMHFVLQVCNKGWKRAAIDSFGLQRSVCVAESQVTSQSVAKYTQSTYTPVEQLLAGDIETYTQQTQTQQQQQQLLSLKQQLASFRSQQGMNTGFFIEA